ncbi:MAG TPA: PKD domain-containing protein, partial [Saprospiraceae bacterium]|nr:PKD domain-containing protein [Saprospiraceae bacterium]
MSRPLLALTFTCLWLALAGPAFAQPCTRTGWVSSVLPGCGAVIIDQSTGEPVRAVKGADLLSGGQYIRYTASPAPPPPACPTSPLPTVALTCLSDTLPCTAQFDHAPGQDKTLERYFEAFITDAQQQTCTWFFGDGSTGTGHSVKHTYAQAGVYEVCLAVSDVWGCQAKSCRKVIVGQGPSLTCGYDLLATAVDKTLLGQLLPKSNPAGELLAVQWRLSKQSELLAETPSLLYNLPHYGTYIVTAEYAVRLPDGSFCTSANSEVLVVTPPTCDQPLNTDAILFCGPQEAPVCGCDQITYPNECEALTSGVSTWWAGTCDQVPGPCHAQVEAQVLVGSPMSGFFTRFRNLSTGNYVFAQLDFGDGSAPWRGTQVDSVITHHYPSGGIYRANFTVWSPNGCESSVTQLVVTDALQRTKGKLPPATDYVYPGDTDGDKKANVYDLLNIGVGHDSDGVPRPNAHTDWMPQFAPNWSDAVDSKVNFKHLDCNGDGTLNDFDADVIQLHYQAIQPKQMIPAPQAPRLWVDLQGPDTLKINPAKPGTLQLEAHVMLGSPAEPVLGLYGLAYALQYPEFVNHDPEAVFLSSNSTLFGEK